MPVNVATKAAPVHVPATAPKPAKKKLAEMSNGELVDRLGSLTEYVNGVRTEVEDEFSKRTAQEAEEIEAVESMLRERHGNLPREENAEVPGEQFIWKLGKVPAKRIIYNIKAAAKALGDKTWWELCKVNLGDLDEYLNPKQLEKCVKEQEPEEGQPLPPRKSTIERREVGKAKK